jgi:hypothetical protein
MKINNSFFYINNYNNTCIKQTYPNFKSHDLLDLPPKDIFEKIEKSINYKNFLGQGTEAEVYKIKDTNYCVRIPYLANDAYKTIFSKELSPIDKVNHIVAKLGFGASIMKYFDGVTPKRYQESDYGRYQLQEQIANMPVKSYTELLHQIANAIDNEMFFDFSGGNLIVNTEKQKLTAIDFYGIKDNPKPIKPLTEIYFVLTSYGSEEKTGKKIYDKIIDAGLEEFKPNKIPCMDVKLFDFIDLVLKRNSDNNSHKQGDITEYINKFLDFKYSIAEKLRELKRLKIQEITDKSVSKELEATVKSFAQLVKRTH